MYISYKKEENITVSSYSSICWSFDVVIVGYTQHYRVPRGKQPVASGDDKTKTTRKNVKKKH